jgi:tetratricopeptide (TPR) repeat protein
VSFNPRIEELRRRIQKDPASIAFAQLAEEHRRAREYDEAIRVCRAGLEQHPAYLSARITLGRALLEVGQPDEAATEFEYVLRAAPDNLTAIRELADIHQRRRVSKNQSRSNEREAHQLPAEETAVGEASVWAAPVSAKPVVEPVSEPVWAAPERIEPPAPTPFVPELEPEPEPEWAVVSEQEPEWAVVSEQEPEWAAVSEGEPELLAVSEPEPEPEPAPDPVLVELEAWLAVLAADRVNRSPHV